MSSTFLSRSMASGDFSDGFQTQSPLSQKLSASLQIEYLNNEQEEHDDDNTSEFKVEQQEQSKVEQISEQPKAVQPPKRTHQLQYRSHASSNPIYNLVVEGKSMHTARSASAEWIRISLNSSIPSDFWSRKSGRVYFASLLSIIALEGKLNSRVRAWVVGYAATVGISGQVLSEVRLFMPPDTGARVLASAMETQFRGMFHPSWQTICHSLIYDTLRAINAASEYGTHKWQMLKELSRSLQIDSVLVDELIILAAQESVIQRKRERILRCL